MAQIFITYLVLIVDIIRLCQEGRLHNAVRLYVDISNLPLYKRDKNELGISEKIGYFFTPFMFHQFVSQQKEHVTSRSL